MYLLYKYTILLLLLLLYGHWMSREELVSYPRSLTTIPGSQDWAFSVPIKPKWLL